MPTRLCLIDDDAFVRDALALGLRDAGFEVVTAPGAAAGLDVVARGGADVIVTDLNMPGTSGAQLIGEARARWPDLPIVAITGAATINGAPAAELAMARGADQCLIKPFRARALVDAVEHVLARRRD